MITLKWSFERKKPSELKTSPKKVTFREKNPIQWRANAWYIWNWKWWSYLLWVSKVLQILGSSVGIIKKMATKIPQLPGNVDSFWMVRFPDWIDVLLGWLLLHLSFPVTCSKPYRFLKHKAEKSKIHSLFQHVGGWRLEVVSLRGIRGSKKVKSVDNICVKQR